MLLLNISAGVISLGWVPLQSDKLFKAGHCDTPLTAVLKKSAEVGCFSQQPLFPVRTAPLFGFQSLTLINLAKLKIRKYKPFISLQCCRRTLDMRQHQYLPESQVYDILLTHDHYLVMFRTHFPADFLCTRFHLYINSSHRCPIFAQYPFMYLFFYVFVCLL